MNHHYVRNSLVFSAILAFTVSFAGPALGQTITVGLDSSTARSFPMRFYGANGQERDSLPWDQEMCTAGVCIPDNPGFSPALQRLHYGILRFPGGTGANYWNWSTGDSVTNYDPDTLKGAEKPPSPFPAPLSEFAAELNSASQPGGTTPTRGDYVLNMLTDPLCVTFSGGFCGYSPSSPNETYQLQLLQQLANDQISVGHLELGNEFFYDASIFPNYPVVYPTVTKYANVANQWITDIKNLYPSVKIAAVGANSAKSYPCDLTAPRIDSWNCGLMNTLVGADAVTLHVYPPSGLCVGNVCSPLTDSTAETMLETPFTSWDTIVSHDFPSLTNNNYVPNIWFTEYNLNDPNTQALGTWAQGLYVATFSLLYATNPRVEMALHHDVQSTGPGGDIFATNDAFSQAYGISIGTAIDGYTAMGLTSREVDIAALGQTNAEALTFPSGPTFDNSTHPKLIGEVFSNCSGNCTATTECPSGSNTTVECQIIILNLDNQPHTVNISGPLPKGGTYRQIYGSAKTYVDGNLTSNGFEGFDANLAPDNLTLVSSPLPLPGAVALVCGPNSSATTACLPLPPFSITRIIGQ